MARPLLLFIAVLLMLPLIGAASHPDEGFSFIALSDTHLMRSPSGYRIYPATKRIVDEVTGGERPDFVVHCGDMLNVNPPGRDTEAIERMWRLFMSGVRDPLVRAGVLFFPCPGNHDVCGGGREVYERTWRDFSNPRAALRSGSYGSYYSFAFRGSTFIVLDGASLSLGEEQAAWARRTFAGLDRSGPVILVCHAGIVGGKRHPKERLDEAARVLIKEGRPDFLICGHQHEFSISHHDGLTQVCVGSAGETPPYYYSLFTVKGRSVTFRTLCTPR